MSAHAHQKVIDALERLDLTGRGGLHRCPAHEDSTPSLKVTDKADRVLIYDHAGCDTIDVLEALGLEWGDLFDDPAAGKGWQTSTLKKVGARANGDGRVELGAVAYLPGGSPKTLAVVGSTRGLWPDPSAVEGTILFVVEGEPDAVTAAQLGIPAVAIPGAGKFDPGWPARIAEGRERVVFIPDADGPGRKAAAKWAAAIAEHCADVRVLDLEPDRDDGRDLSDYAADAVTDADRADLRRCIVGAAESVKPIVTRVPEPLAPGTPANGAPEPNPRVPEPLAPPTRRGFGTLRRCDVAGMLATEPEPVDYLVEGVVARGYLSLLVGREKTGKSLLALATSARCAEGGGSVAGIQCAAARVLYVDCENGSREIHRRVRLLGLTTAHGLVVYEGAGFNLASGLDELDAVLTDVRPDLVWLDSWRSMWVGDENSAQEASAALDPLRELIRRHNVGAGLLHHANKLGQYRGSTAVGASVENIVELSRAEDDEDRRRRRLRNSACRFEQEAGDRWVRLEADRSRGLLLIDEAEAFVPSQGGRPRDERDCAADELLAALSGKFTAWPDWARAAGLDPKHGTARRARDELADRRLVIGAQGLWRKPGTNGEEVAR